MKQFHCRCGQPVFFDSTSCVNCGALLGFDRSRLQLIALRPESDGSFVDDSGKRYRPCLNGTEFDACNWLLPADASNQYCWACRFNRTIPDQSRPRNNRRLRRFESAKKRLFYSLIRLDLPLVSGFDDPEDGLLFDFIEDQRSDPERFPESFVQTGFHGGVITVNTLEADDDVRESVRVKMNESYRSLLGHLRHESGHYYWSILDPDTGIQDEFRRTFGDAQADYGAALERHYADGPRFGWQEHYISAYASAHPIEDWAETWAHYLLIADALETAAAHGILDCDPDSLDVAQSVNEWRTLSVALNELNRSSGLGDAYPFVVSEAVVVKLGFVEQVVRQLGRQNRAPEDC